MCCHKKNHIAIKAHLNTLKKGLVKKGLVKKGLVVHQCIMINT